MDDIESSIFMAVDLQITIIHLFEYEILITVVVAMNELLDSACYGSSFAKILNFGRYVLLTVWRSCLSVYAITQVAILNQFNITDKF